MYTRLLEFLAEPNCALFLNAHFSFPILAPRRTHLSLGLQSFFAAYLSIGSEDSAVLPHSIGNSRPSTSSPCSI